MDFASSCQGITVQPKAYGLDFTAVPGRQGSQQASLSFRERIREDFWKAFTIFPRIGARRVYDRLRDSIFYEDETKPLGTNVLITPISKEQQLTWRKEFVPTLQSDIQSQLLAALDSRDPFKQFNSIVSLNTPLFKTWHDFKVAKVRTIVQAWADLNRVPQERWMVLPEDQKVAQDRKVLYRFLDGFALEKLLEIKIPIRWVLERDANKDSKE